MLRATAVIVCPAAPDPGGVGAYAPGKVVMTAFESSPPSSVPQKTRAGLDTTAGDRGRAGAPVSLRRTDVECGAGSTATLLALAGEIDASNSSWLTVRLNTMITSASTGHGRTAPSSGVVIDLTRLRFCDASGITVLVKAFKHARNQRLVLSMAGATGRVDRVLRLTGIGEVISLHPKPADALAALRRRDDRTAQHPESALDG
ncbi:STAS domain-containing protein [Actinomadura sp. 7K534]|uniref:STAS domain-containing protein n=2 Tax=unclassified Actinomadura TaxID=2626254 RepID=UPI0010440578|nr:STAS domain-containing protein [Actinomadura sp. 7K534]TDB89871.1 anti-sigma factor antagonist [Actinomadura sp. 7K534]TDC69863.1 anti-sigma factor antagonist [Actinomadura sp. GC306]